MFLAKTKRISDSKRVNTMIFLAICYSVIILATACFNKFNPL